MSCACREPDCMHFDCGYPWCRACGEHHRPPECAIDEQGRSLAYDGRPWEEHERESAAKNASIQAQWAADGHTKSGSPWPPVKATG